jgi:hypothetical protein
MAAVAGATQYNVGGDNGWGVPGAGDESYNTWAEKTGFQIGDQLRQFACSTFPAAPSWLPFRPCRRIS